MKDRAFLRISLKKADYEIPGSEAVAAGDYNNDGFLDLFISSAGEGNPALYRNLGNGTFEPVKNAAAVFSAMQKVKINDAVFFDFDNDGYLDLIMGGKSGIRDGRGFFYTIMTERETSKMFRICCLKNPNQSMS